MDAMGFVAIIYVGLCVISVLGAIGFFLALRADLKAQRKHR